jgi:hypothetical protein
VAKDKLHRMLCGDRVTVMVVHNSATFEVECDAHAPGAGRAPVGVENILIFRHYSVSNVLFRKQSG